MDKSDNMVDHLAELFLTHTPGELDRLVRTMQDWTQSAPLKGRQHPIQPPPIVINARISAKGAADRQKHILVLQEKVTLLLSEHIANCSKQISDLQQQELDRSILSKIQTCCMPDARIAELIDELQHSRAALESFKSDLAQVLPEDLERDLLGLLKTEKLPDQILVALKRVVAEPDLHVQRVVQREMKGQLRPAASMPSDIPPMDDSEQHSSGSAI